MAELKIKADSGGGTVSLKGPATTTSNAAVQLTLPVDDGTANQYLKTDGSGALSWATVDTSIADDSIVEAKLDIHAAPSGTDKFLGYTSNGMEWAVPGGGKVLQWVAGRYTNDRESTTDTSNFVAMPDGLSITPTAASSRILMMVTLSINEDTSGNTWLDFGRTISGGSISRLSGLTNGLTSYSTPTGFITLNMSYVDHPNTTTSTLYQVMINAGAGTVALNDYATTTGSSMTLLELAG